MAMQQAAFALGYGGIWRTGNNAHNPHMKPLLGLEPEDEIVGYLYLGTAVNDIQIKPQRSLKDQFLPF